jgi:hypothetical protein
VATFEGAQAATFVAFDWAGRRRIKSDFTERKNVSGSPAKRLSADWCA